MKAFTVSAFVTTGVKNATKEQVETALENFLSRMADELELEIEEVVGENDSHNYVDWEIAVVQCLASQLECSYQDAQDIVEAQDFYMTQSWTKGLTPAETAKLIDEKSKA